MSPGDTVFNNKNYATQYQPDIIFSWPARYWKKVFDLVKLLFREDWCVHFDLMGGVGVSETYQSSQKSCQDSHKIPANAPLLIFFIKSAGWTCCSILRQLSTINFNVDRA